LCFTTNNLKMNKLHIILSMLACAHMLTAQRLDMAQKHTCPTPDGGEVVLYRATETPNGYYCLPSHLRLSIEEGTPEFLLMLWGDEGAAEVSNGIMHWLLTWGLDKANEQAVQNYLTTKVDSNAVLLGTVTVQSPERYILTGENKKLLQLLQNALQTGGSIPTTSGGKSATSFKIVGENAEWLRQNARKPEAWKGVFIEMPFYSLPGQHLTTLQLGTDVLMKVAVGCKECFVVP
jgi:hypothetical protein